MFHLSALLFGAFALSDAFFRVNWTDGSRTAVSIKADGVRPVIAECLDTGRLTKVRIEMRLCRKRSSWLDACTTERSELHAIDYDIITESYRVVSDLHGDGSEPVAVGVPTRAKAIDATVSIDKVDLAFLARGDEELLRHENNYLQTRAIVVCKGSVNRLFAHLSQIVTLGIVNVKEEDSGWIDFPINQRRSDSSE